MLFPGVNWNQIAELLFLSININYFLSFTKTPGSGGYLFVINRVFFTFKWAEGFYIRDKLGLDPRYP